MPPGRLHVQHSQVDLMINIAWQVGARHVAIIAAVSLPHRSLRDGRIPVQGLPQEVPPAAHYRH